jgi:signal peptidase
VVLAVFLALALAGVLAPAFGWRLDVVQSGSMSPAIGVGDLVITSPCDPDEVRVGDVICFRSEGMMVCHRVVSVDSTNETIVTKGDANEDPDPSPVPFDNVVGKVALNVPFLGYVVSFLKGPFGWALMILLAILVLVAGGEGRDPQRKKAETGEGKG